MLRNVAQFGNQHENLQFETNRQRFRDHGTGAAGTGQPGGGRQQMEKQDGQISTSDPSKIATSQGIFRNLAIRHAHPVPADVIAHKV